MLSDCTCLDAPVKGIESMTGIMINTVPRRVILNPKSTVLDTLLQLQSEQLDISKHESIALAELQSEGISVFNLFNTIFNVRNKIFTEGYEVEAANTVFQLRSGKLVA